MKKDNKDTEEKEIKPRKEKKVKEKKKKVSLKRTYENNLFALRAIGKAAPVYLGVFFFSSVIYGIFDFLSDSYLLRKIVKSIEGGESISYVVRYVLALGICMTAVYGFLNWFWNVIAPVQRRKVGAYVERMLFKKSAEVELACYENPAFYDKYVKAMDEAYSRILKVMYTLDNLLYRVIALFANSILIFVIDPVLILFGLFPLLLGIFRRLDNIAKHDFEAEKKPINRRAKYVRRTFYLGEYAKEMRIGGMHENMLRDLRDTYGEYKKLYRKYGVKRAIFGFIQRFGLDIVTILGATLYAVWSTMIRGSMDVADCIVVIGSIGTISHCLNNLVQNFAEFGEHALFLDDVRFFLDYEPKIKNGEKEAPEDGGDIEVKNLSFAYEGSDCDTLKNINFTWKKGERIALVGSNGSGKTTLVKLLLRLYDPKEGEITLSGENIKNFTLSSYRGLFSSVFQDFKLFSMNVKENILLRPEKDGDKELVENALKESGIYEKISSFENGIDTILTREFDDKGENLSGGEAQKVSLARIFADRDPLLLLDEPSSALDPIAEYKMFENMMRATEGRSVIFISHRLSSATLADKVLLMEDGRIAECGTHSELMQKDGKYAALFKRQAENYLGEEARANG